MDGPSHTEGMPDMDAIARTMQRIRGERDVLRMERDALRRDFDFFKVETRFTTESLENRLRTALSSSASSTSTSLSSSTRDLARMADARKAAMVSILVAQHLQSAHEQTAAQMATLTQSVQRAEKRAEDAERMVKEKDAEMRRIRYEDVQMRDSLTMAEVKLSNTESKIADLTTLVTRLEEDLHQERTDHEETGTALARAESQISELSKSLDDAESQRGSLALQVTHLEQDVGNLKTELEESEDRYRILQQEQLSAMSAHEATKALRRQIEELEARVLRRTEQIGVHQHDIKKLEMNLRLQEERVSELTSDVEVLETQKTAMLEDCRTTREERDAAMKRCEALEENVEMLEVQSATMEEQRTRELQAMVGVVTQSVAKRRTVSRALSLANSRYAAHEAQFAAQLRIAEETHALTTSHSEQLSSEHSRALATLHETTSRLQAAEHAERDAYTQSQQATVALATVYSGFQQSRTSLALVQGARTSLHAQLAAVRADLDAKLAELSALHTRYEALQASSTKASTEAQARHGEEIAALEARCETLRTAHADLETQHTHTLAELARAQDALRAHASNTTEDTLRAELAAAQARFQADADGLRAELAAAAAQLEDARVRAAEAASAHRVALEDTAAVREELQLSLREALAGLEARRAAEGALADELAQRTEEIETVRERLDAAERDVRDITAARDALLAEHGSVAQELEARRAEADALRAAKEDLERQVESAEACHAAELKALERRVADALQEKADVQRALAEVEVRLDEARKALEELEDNIAKASADAEVLRAELTAEREGRVRDAEQHARALEAAREEGSRAQLGHGELLEQIDALRAQLRDAEDAVRAAAEEKLGLQTQMTDLEAEIQRSLSLQRHQESQIQEAHKQIAALNEKVEKTRADYIRAEKEAKTAEINLSLQAVQHEKTVSNLRKELEALQESSKLEETVLELREKNEEMEELLRAKCLEIEENDDRFIELIKEKKKLTSKVENLTRKVKSLQDKLAANSQDSTPKATPLPTASTSVPPVASTSTFPPVPPVPSTSTLPPVPPVPTHPIASPAPLFQTMSSSSRTRSSTTPAAASRPKTPEARMPPTVFKARTPESRRRPSHQSSHDPMPPKATFQPLQDAFQPYDDPMTASASSSSIGKKRRAPDDFEDCESVPPQVFTADSMPSQDNPNTPRVRRATHNARVGFTPVRGGRAAAAAQPPSPRSRTSTAGSSGDTRGTGAAAPIIADVTNSPRSKAAQKAKRGWLSTLRGGAAQSARTAGALARPVFDRAQNAR